MGIRPSVRVLPTSTKSGRAMQPATPHPYQSGQRDDAGGWTCGVPGRLRIGQPVGLDVQSGPDGADGDGTHGPLCGTGQHDQWQYVCQEDLALDLHQRLWPHYFNLLSYTSQVNLLRFRTAADASLAYVFVSSSGKLGLRNDSNGTTLTSATSVGSGWHGLELHVRINGRSSVTEVWFGWVLVSGLALTTKPRGPRPLGDCKSAR